MAEEQETQKPKATLIKNRRTEGGEQHAETRKIRVVVKRKPKPKVVAKQREESTPEEHVEHPKPNDDHVGSSTEPSSKRSGSAEPRRHDPRPQGATTSTTRTEPRRPRDPGRSGPRGAHPYDRRGTAPRPGYPGGAGDRRPGSRDRADGGASRGGYQRNESGSRPRGPRGGGPRGPRPGAAMRPGPRPGYGGNRGPHAGESGFRTGRPGMGPPQQQTGRPDTRGGKRFYKSRQNKRSGYERRDREREREVRFSGKKQITKTNPVPKEIDIMEVITVSELARKMNLKANELIGKLMGMGMMVTINQQIDAETAEILAAEYSCKVNIVSLYDETVIETTEDRAESLASRSPIVTVMGHVDHGKTKLLDSIRTTDVVAGESGGITQHIGAYQVHLDQGVVTFLDTPGHEAFTLMRARGAQVTDIVILVVAADDGIMPQTKEAISHAKDAGVPIIVAINKVDLPDANVDRVKQQLSETGLIPDDWGGDTAVVEVSALTGVGVPDLLETVLVQAEVLELKSNFDRNAEGKVIESRIDAGRGTVATVLIERGTLHVGESFVAGIYAGRVRAMFNDRGERVEAATPSMPVEVLGFSGVPQSGDPFQVTDDEKTARQVGDKRQELKRVEVAKNVKKITLDNLYDSIQQGAIQELKVVLKGDVHGSVEALQSALEGLSTAEIRLSVIHAAAGAINENDIMLASASEALLVGFHVRPTPRAQMLAEREKVYIRKYSVIYDAVEDIRSAMEGMLAPDLKEEVIGTVEVRDTFKVPRVGVIAGCYVSDGKVTRNAKVRVFREGVQVYEGTIGSLKRFKDDAKEVATGFECGIAIDGFHDVQVGDQVEAFLVREVAKKL